MIKIKAITSGKGGVGKSTCSIELAFALEKLGKRVLLIDADQGMRCLDMLLGVSENLLFDLSDAVKGRELSSCLLSVKKHPYVYHTDAFILGKTIGSQAKTHSNGIVNHCHLFFV